MAILTNLDETRHFSTAAAWEEIYSLPMGKTLRLSMLGGVLLLSLQPSHCEDLANGPAFEVAAITPCAPGTPPPGWEHDGNPKFTSPGGRFTARATTLKFLIEWAYGILPAQHTGGPGWLGMDRYDVVAKAEGDATEQR